MNRGMNCTIRLAALMLAFAAPVGADPDSGGPAAADELAAESPAILAYDAAWRADAVTAPPIRPDAPAATVSPLALVGAATLLFLIVALGLTLTFRSLHTDIRRQRDIDRHRDPDAHRREEEARRH